ncbi:hypothetical protein EV183_004429 [Coemansia sp. RSA 2336]|nr:hypothetical protein EV183_004429 [Coemansia sp. RSA 2336]
MLQTPRAAASGGSTHENNVLGKRRMQHKPPPVASAFQPRKKRPQHGKQEKYRDRAAERREQGVSPMQGAESSTVEPSVLEPALAKSTTHQLYEQSKYLGGDVERTHLVKGLDYLLLEKQRLQARASDEDLDEQLEQLETAHIPSIADTALKYHAQTSLGIKIVDILQQSSKPKAVEVNELFVPGRMYYEFELRQPQPTATLCIRSKQEVLQMGEGFYSSDSVDRLVVSKVIAAIVTAKRADEPSVKQSEDYAESPEELDDDDDIFSDVSDEVVVEPYPDSE